MKRLSEATEVYELAKRGAGSLPPFIEGLIASSLLIEEIKQDLDPRFSVKWGQVIGKKGELSKEVDAIIFKGKPLYEWQNIGYAIIPQDQVKAAIEVNIWFGSSVSSINEYHL